MYPYYSNVFPASFPFKGPFRQLQQCIHTEFKESDSCLEGKRNHMWLELRMGFTARGDRVAIRQ